MIPLPTQLFFSIGNIYNLLQHRVEKKKSAMFTSIKQMKNRPQDTPNVIRIHNYSYYSDRVVGSGNFSTVFQAFSHTTHNKIAAKVVKMSSLTFKKLEELLDQQIQILLTLDHINTIKCFDVLKTHQQCYIFTEFCDAGTLDKVLKQRGPLSEQEAWPYIKGIYEGLKYLSSKNIIHRDLKPANIFLKGDTVKIADFGFAVQARQKFHDMNIGSPFYMAPEAFIDNIYGNKTDVWAFGITLYELLHGKTPFFDINDGDSLKQRVLVPIRRQDFKPEISYELRELVLRCLQIDESKRISMNEIENSYFMRKKLFGNIYQQDRAKSQLGRFGTHGVIRIPSRITIKDNDDEDGNKGSNQTQRKRYYEMPTTKSSAKVSYLDKRISGSSLETSPESPYIIRSRMAVHRPSAYQLKDEIRESKTVRYGWELRQNSQGSANLITIK